MNIFKKILFCAANLGKNFFFPSVCALCGGSLFAAAEIHCALCEQCAPLIVPIQGNRCIVCGKPLISEIDICVPCRNIQGRSYDRLWVFFPYTGKYRKLLAAYKFEKKLVLADFFAEKIIKIISEDSVLKDAAIVPVPPRPGKIKDSGWDQINYLGKRLKKKEGCVPVYHCLKRSKSKAQKYLNRTERMENLKGRIFIQGAAPKIALLIDDVITTGSTIEVCAEVLKKAGAEKVYGLCLFYD